MLSLARSLARSFSLCLSLSRARALSLFMIAHHALPLTHPDMHLELLDEFAVFPRVNVSVAVSIKDRGNFPQVLEGDGLGQRRQLLHLWGIKARAVSATTQSTVLHICELVCAGAQQLTNVPRTQIPC